MKLEYVWICEETGELHVSHQNEDSVALHIGLLDIAKFYYSLYPQWSRWPHTVEYLGEL